MINQNRLNEYINVKSINNKYSKNRLSSILSKIEQEDRMKMIKRVRCFYLNRKKNNEKIYFIHQDYMYLIILKQPKKKIEQNLQFGTIRVLNSNYIAPVFYSNFIEEFQKLKPRKKIEYVIPLNDPHLHFTINISIPELKRTMKKILDTDYFGVLKFKDIKLEEQQTNYFNKKNENENVPILFVPVNEIEEIENYMASQGNIKIINPR